MRWRPPDVGWKMLPRAPRRDQQSAVPLADGFSRKQRYGSGYGGAFAVERHTIIRLNAVGIGKLRRLDDDGLFEPSRTAFATEGRRLVEDVSKKGEEAR
jgi:hypothetical protein